MKAIIIEDESLAVNRLEKLIAEIDPSIEIVAKAGSVNESVKVLTKEKVDLIFLDIQLSDGISFSIFDRVTVNTPIIFTTAYDQYAIRAFQLNSIAYLLKPIRKAELEESITKYKSLKSAFSIDFDGLMAELKGEKPDYRKRFLIQIGNKFRKVETGQIAYFYAFDKNVFLKTFDDKRYAIDLTLDGLESSLDPEKFFRINRKYLVNMDAITNMYALSRSRIKLELNPPTDENMEAIVSIDRASDFRKWLNS